MCITYTLKLFYEFNLFTISEHTLYCFARVATTSTIVRVYPYVKLISPFYSRPSNNGQKFRTPTLRPFLAIEIKNIKGG